LYTWITPADLSRHQLDYILVKHRFRNSMMEAQTMPGADIDSDHNMLVVKIYIKLKETIKFHKGGKKTRWDLEKIQVHRQKVQDTLDEKLGFAINVKVEM